MYSCKLLLEQKTKKNNVCLELSGILSIPLCNYIKVARVRFKQVN